MHVNQNRFFSSRSGQTIIRFALAMPLVAMLASCGGQVTLTKDANATQPTVTRGAAHLEYPDDTPSSADGKVVWAKAQCAQCHGEGTGGSSKVNFSDKAYMDQQKPDDQYMFVTYALKPEGGAEGEYAYTKEVPNHPKTFDTLTKRERWDLVFYMRSLSRPIISNSNPEFLAIDATFGSNCAVCHGKKGNGDGPLATHLEPVPANFASYPRFYDRTDAVLWDHIANGIPWEGMPNFQHHGVPKHDKAKNVTFDDAYIWKLVQYVRHFQSTDVGTAVAQSNNSQENAAKETTSTAPSGNSEHNAK